MLKKTISLSIFAIALFFPTTVKADDINLRTGDVIINSNDDGIKVNTRSSQIRLDNDRYDYKKPVYRQNSRSMRSKRYKYWSKNQKIICQGNRKVIIQESTQINDSDRYINKTRTYQNCK